MMGGCVTDQITLRFDLEEDGRFIATLSYGDEERVSCYGTDEYSAAAGALSVFFGVENWSTIDHERWKAD